MKTKKRFIPLIVIFPVFIFLMYCSRAGQAPSNVNDWKIGTSVSRLQNYSEDDFAQLKQAGFDCIEVGLSGINIENISDETYLQCQSIYEKASAAGIHIWSIHIPYGRTWDISNPDKAERLKAINRITELLTICEFLKPEKLVIHASFEPIPENERAARFESCRESLRILTNEAASYNAQLTVECLPRTCIGNTSEEILALIQGIDGIGVCCDVNHLLFETTEDFILNVGSLISTLHISDYDGKDEKHWLPGEGIMNWNKVLESLTSTGYNGPFMFECSGSPGEKMESWKKLKADYLNYKAK